MTNTLLLGYLAVVGFLFVITLFYLKQAIEDRALERKNFLDALNTANETQHHLTKAQNRINDLEEKIKTLKDTAPITAEIIKIQNQEIEMLEKLYQNKSNGSA